MIDGELHELRETIIRGGHRTLGHAVAVLAIRTLISSFLLSHICTCFGLCNSLGGHICGDSYEG